MKAAFFFALSHPERMDLIGHLVDHGPLSIEDLRAKFAQFTARRLQRHMALLRKHRIVEIHCGRTKSSPPLYAIRRSTFHSLCEWTQRLLDLSKRPQQ